MKYILLTISLILGANTVAADKNCKLSFASGRSADTDVIIRENSFKTEVIFMSKYTTTVFECSDNAVVDEYECYGFLKPPGNSPVQLNIQSTNEGDLVTLIALNMFFLNQFTSDGWKALDKESRRFSVDVYNIDSCN